LLESIPESIYSALPYVLAPVIGNPLAMAARYVPRDTTGPQQVAALLQNMQRMLPVLEKLAEVLPQPTLVWRLQLLQDGCRYLDNRYSEVGIFLLFSLRQVTCTLIRCLAKAR
jgi:hypothetical protein